MKEELVKQVKEEAEWMTTEEKLTKTEAALDEATVHLSTLATMLPQFLPTHDLTDVERLRLVFLIERYQEVMAAALSACSAVGVTEILEKLRVKYDRVPV